MKKAILVATLPALLITILVLVALRETRTNYHEVAKEKLTAIMIASTPQSPRNTRKSLDEILEKAGFQDDEIAWIYEPYTKKRIKAFYISPMGKPGDSLVFGFSEPIHPFERKKYTEKDRKDLKYVLLYSESGFHLVSNLPQELNLSEPVELTN